MTPQRSPDLDSPTVDTVGRAQSKVTKVFISFATAWGAILHLGRVEGLRSIAFKLAIAYTHKVSLQMFIS